MTTTEKEEIRDLVIASLERSERIYGKVKPLIESREVKFASESLETDIPGFPVINEDEPKVANFIAFVLDVRGSTSHLLQACSSCAVQMLERTLYESSAINTMGAYVINKRGGSITEFLGDGFLALFKAEQNSDVHKANYAAKECLEGLEIVNNILASRYSLPALQVGIGLAYSQAIVMSIKANEKYYPKALGECVYRASKLSSGYNEILFDDRLKYYWPTTKAGTLKFVEVNNKHKSDVQGYKIEKTN